MELCSNYRILNLVIISIFESEGCFLSLWQNGAPGARCHTGPACTRTPRTHAHTQPFTPLPHLTHRTHSRFPHCSLHSPLPPPTSRRNTPCTDSKGHRQPLPHRHARSLPPRTNTTHRRSRRRSASRDAPHRKVAQKAPAIPTAARAGEGLFMEKRGAGTGTCCIWHLAATARGTSPLPECARPHRALAAPEPPTGSGRCRVGGRGAAAQLVGLGV